MSELLDFLLDQGGAFKSKARLTSLYSDFSNLKVTNPEGYAANALAWRSALENASRAGVTPGDNFFSLHTGEKLLSALEYKGLGKPSALSTVLRDAVAAKQMIPLKEFLGSNKNVYQKSWIPPLPSAMDVARWGFERIGLFGSSSDKLIEGDYVVMANVEEAASKLVLILQNELDTPTSLVHSLATFTHAFSTKLSPNTARPLSQTDISILLTHLGRDKHLAAISPAYPNFPITIKLTPQPAASPPAITRHDQTIATLQTLAVTLSTSVTALQTRIESLTDSLNSAVKTSNRPLALTYLRAKKAASQTLIAREASLHQTRGVLDAIDDAASNIEIVRAMEAGAGVLADLNAQVGGAEGVQRVMDAVRDGVVEVEEISGAIGEVGEEGVDEGEVEEEMMALEKEEREKIEGARKEDETRKTTSLKDALPSVPVALPGSEEKDGDVQEEEISENTQIAKEKEPVLTA